MKKISFIALAAMILLSASCLTAFADTAADQAAPAEETYVYPVIAPTASVYAGYRFVDHDGSTQSAEYEYLKDSLAFGGEYRIFRFPHRFHLDFEAKNIKDYFGDVSYAYEDVVLFRGLFRGLYHNLDNVSLIDMNPATPSPGIDIRDAGVDYGVKFNMSSFFARFKTHDFPFHVYLDGNYIVRDGLQQQRFLLGSGSNNSIIRTSQARDVDWTTKNIVVGVNSHLGPVEVDISHGEKRFDANGTSVFYDSYSAVTANPPRAAGAYPHNLIPDLKGSSNTLKLHTSYTGRLVGSMTLTKNERENQNSGAKSDYLVGAGEMIWTIRPEIQAYLKYNHKEISLDNPYTATMSDLLNPANSYTYAVERSISSITDSVVTGARYRPLKGLSFRAEYSYDNIKRDHTEATLIQEETTKQVISLFSDIRLVKGLSVNVKYAHKEISDPAYNIEPNRSDEGKISAVWLPFPFLSTMVTYGISDEQRNDIYWLETNLTRTFGDSRSVRRDRLVGSITLTAIRNVAITGSAAYMHNRIVQDLEYHDATGVPQVYPSVPYSDMVQSYSLDVRCTPLPQASLSGGIMHSISSGSFSPSDSVLTQPVSVASFSQMKMRETVLTAGGDYQFRGGLAAGVEYRYSRVKDVLENPHDDIGNGRTHIVLLTLSKKW